MGLQIGDIVPRRALEFSELKGKVIAVDAYNALYQFLSSVRQPDGTPLMDSKGNVTSHLSGLFYRNVSLLGEGMKLIYVFDGEYSELKQKTKDMRKDAKDKARSEFESAKDLEDVESMGKYARQLGRLTKEMIEESKELLEAMGISVFQAPGEGEMQCAQFVKEGKAFGVGSQDYDALAVGGKLIQNLTLAKTRKTVSGTIFISPELIEYEETLQKLGVDGDGLITIGILVGTDYNPKGVPGIGPKKALKMVQEKKFPALVFANLEGRVDFDWKEVFELFKKPNVSKGEEIVFPKLDVNKIKEILVDRHEFSNDRVEKQLEKLELGRGKASQQTLF